MEVKKKRTAAFKSREMKKFRNMKGRMEKDAKHITNTALLHTEDQGFLEPDEDETTTQFKQSIIAKNVDITSAAKFFQLNLEFGPYSLNYTRNGRHLILGGKKGHVAAFDWVTKKLACEMNVMESIHDVAWLHNENMFAVAQSKWVYIYDYQGIEIHCLKRMNDVTNLEFLPYHFLLASSSTSGYLNWLDVSIGKIISRYNSRLGRINLMTQNPGNAVLCIGDNRGVVSMWSPNSQQPLAKMLCHKQAVSSCTVHPHGTYMATSCPDRSVKVWDVRQLCGPVRSVVLRSAATKLAYSQKGLLAIGMGNVVEVYRDTGDDFNAYIRHKSNWGITDLQFCPYEDVLGLGTVKGFTSILVPGCAEANFDALEVNPFQTKRQRREAEVKALLEKIQPDLITLDPSAIGEVDIPTLKDKVDAKKKLLFIKPKAIDFKPRRTKAKGKGGTAKVIKSRKILKDLARKEAIEAMQQSKTLISEKKKEERKNTWGVLERFLPKTS